jgi:hypothetical protein
MAIGSPDKAKRLDQLRTYVRCQVRSGFAGEPAVRADVLDAVRAEEPDPDRARSLADELIAAERAALAGESRNWPAVTDFDRLQASLQDLREAGLEVMEAVDDHWAVEELLTRRKAVGRPPRGVAYFTVTDVWHAVEHGMLELNVWHGSSANVAPGDDLLTLACHTLVAHGLSANFDEGRIEVTLCWQRRPAPGSSPPSVHEGAPR